MAAPKARTGLVSYGGDSEVSDSEVDEDSMSVTNSPPSDLVLPQVMANSLGIPGPSSKARTPSSPPSFVKPVVSLAPLVAYYGDEDDDHNVSSEMDASLANGVFLPSDPVAQSPDSECAKVTAFVLNSAFLTQP